MGDEAPKDTITRNAAGVACLPLYDEAGALVRDGECLVDDDSYPIFERGKISVWSDTSADKDLYFSKPVDGSCFVRRIIIARERAVRPFGFTVQCLNGVFDCRRESLRFVPNLKDRVAIGYK